MRPERCQKGCAHPAPRTYNGFSEKKEYFAGGQAFFKGQSPHQAMGLRAMFGFFKAHPLVRYFSIVIAIIAGFCLFWVFAFFGLKYFQ